MLLVGVDYGGLKTERWTNNCEGGRQSMMGKQQYKRSAKGNSLVADGWKVKRAATAVLSYWATL